MPTDSEYLERAGLNEEGGVAQKETPPTPDVQAPAPTPEEMFELGGQKFPVSTEFSYIHDGKTAKTPYKDLINAQRRATHYQQKWENDGLKKIKEYEEKLKPFDQYKGFYDKYNALQTWSEQNPQDWARLEALWKEKDKHLMAAQTGGQMDPQVLNPLLEKISALEAKLGEFGSVKEKLEAQEKAKTEEEDIGFIKKEISEFQKEFPEIDLNEKDPDGLSLWAKIVHWGDSKGFVEFAPAAMMYLKPRIAELYSMRGRQEAMKSAKTDHQAGVVKRSAQPFNKGQSPSAQNIRNLSYGELAEKAKEDLLAS